MKDFDIQRKPFVVPVDDGKLIEEHFGLASIESNLSLAHMIAPAGWGEPFQTPEFEEYTYIIKGKKKIEVGDEVVIPQRVSRFELEREYGCDIAILLTSLVSTWPFVRLLFRSKR